MLLRVIELAGAQEAEQGDEWSESVCWNREAPLQPSGEREQLRGQSGFEPHFSHHPVG